MKIYLSSPIAMLCGCKVKRILSNSLYLAQCVGSYDVKKNTTKLYGDALLYRVSQKKIAFRIFLRHPVIPAGLTG